MTQIQLINDEINRELADEATVRALLETTFPGFDVKLMKRALTEGMIRGVKFEDFMKKRVYAIKYGEKYSLVFSVDHARALAQQNGIIGSAKAEYEFTPEGKLIACTCTVKKKVGEDVGDFSATAFLDEFNTGKNMWAKMPKHMLAKVAEMHALRKAFPDVLDKAYVEEEMSPTNPIDMLDGDTQEEINQITNVKDLKTYYNANKGKGKAFDKAVTIRKKELESKDTQEPDPTESRVVPDQES